MYKKFFKIIPVLYVYCGIVFIAICPNLRKNKKNLGNGLKGLEIHSSRTSHSLQNKEQQVYKEM